MIGTPPYHPGMAQYVHDPEHHGWAAEDSEGEINIREYLMLLWSGRWIIGVSIVLMLLAGLAWSLTRTKMYATSATLSLDAKPPQIIKNQIQMGASWWEIERYITEQVRVLTSRTLAERVAERLGLGGEGGDPAGRILGMVGVDTVRDSTLVTVSMRGRDPVQITEWLNTYVDEYRELNIEENLQRVREVYDVIQQKLDPLRDQLERSEEQLMEFQEREDSMLFASQDKNVISEQINTLTSAYAEAKNDRIRLETEINALEQLRENNLSLASFPEVMRDETLNTLRKQLQGIELELDENLKTYREGHPVIKDLRGREAGVKAQIRDRIEAIIGALRTDYQIKRRREQSLFANIQQLRRQSIDLSKEMLEFEKLQREYQQNKAFYEQMMARSKEADISGTIAINNSRVIDVARVPSSPVSPNIPRTLMLSIVLGGFFGVGLVFLVDFMDQSIRTPEDVERYLGQEVFAVVPTYSEEKARAMREIYQGLRTAIMFAARGEGGQVVMVTSAGPGEGKTTTTFNLAKVLAAAGSRVLLLDADLRKPAVHRLVHVKNVRGLTSVVLGERTLEDVLHVSPDAPNLHAVTSGPLPPNPPEVYGKASFARLLEEARQSYDWILVDTPPVIAVTDPVVCSKLVDMVVMVVRYGELNRKMVQGALRDLSRAGSRVAGVVVNQVDVERDHYYYDSYYYSYYHYGYGSAARGTSGQARAQPGNSG